MDKKIANKHFRRYTKPALFSCFALLVGFGAFSLSQSAEQGQMQTVNKAGVTVSSVIRGEFKNALNIRGQVVPKTTILLDTVSGGRVEGKLVEQGVYVEQGQPLVRLSNTNLQLDVMSREAQVTEQLNFLRNTQMTMTTNTLNLKRDLLDIELQISHLERRLRQSEALLQKGLTSQDEVDEIRQDLQYNRDIHKLTRERQKQETSIREVQLAQLEDSAKMLQNNLQFARKNLESLQVTAPVSGYLSELDVQVGESKQAGARLGQIDIPGEYKLAVSLDEFYLTQVSLGMSVEISHGGNMLQAQVSKIDSRVTNAQFQIEAELPSGIQDIKRGQGLDAQLMFSDEQARATLLPRGAFFTTSGGHWVFVVNRDGSQAVRRDVRLGKKNQHYYEVISGLAPGEQVITSNYGNFDKAQVLNLTN
ncbi:efflux RND transporter periplasmic adaptor subunit [Pseudoalteromonas luteoviolacea]|uniref:efflux RND transporter periplasmic adaptor subunit n=1 Tax=Pseudoalteromonas luteoviolacea TaxID=43657 RepID=UPI001B39280B|nr:efflux RND transporter periplasmic adaptor subunit [Pseudoalteromonas luteoviolacea]MBQ4812690.1 efflux RND transporter periplasmic adaptor subunit [Pseudoalteromonas luteoviolacea]